jgi:hypothetical protein
MSNARLVGAAVAAAIAAAVPFVGLAGGRLASQIGLACLVVAVPLGWLIAPQAARRGGRAVAIAGFLFAIMAVPIGSVLVAILISRAQGAAPASATEVGSLATFGLIVLGLPMFVIAFSLAVLWAIIVQIVVRPAPQ